MQDVVWIITSPYLLYDQIHFVPLPVMQFKGVQSRNNLDLFASDSFFFDAYAMFDIPWNHPICTTLAAALFITVLYAIELCFLFKVDSNVELLPTTLLLL